LQIEEAKSLSDSVLAYILAEKIETVLLCSVANTRPRDFEENNT
jgi:hypothetical protein